MNKKWKSDELLLCHMKKILVPTDFSPCSEAASEAAVVIAEKTRAEIYFLHLHAPEQSGGHMAMHGGDSHCGHQHHDHAGQARSQLDQLVKKAEHLGLIAKSVLVLDENWEQVEKYIRALSIDFVVIGSHSVHGVKEFFIATNAQRLIRSMAVPLLIIKGKQLNFNPIQIIFASTFEMDMQQSLEFLDSFAAIWNATVHFLFINTSSNSNETNKVKDKMKCCTKHLNVPVQFSISHSEDKETGIREYAKQVNADMIVLTNHHRVGLTRIISPGFAERMVNHAEIPVMVLNY
jgi:nucleotide-binding universal stress UspA family protein